MNLIYAIYDENKEFIAAFPSYEKAAGYGYDHLGDGWRYNILEKAMLDYPIIKQVGVYKH